MADPKETRFKAMSWDEQATVLEQSAQEILRANEERIAPESVEAVEAPQEATETTEISQVTPVQDRNFPEAQDAGREGGLMYQQAQQIMNQMRDNPDLIRLPRLPTDSPEEILAGPSGPDFMNLDNINGSDDPESTMPPAGSSVGVTTQPETGRVSVETSTPNPLSEFINIYSDDESPEASRGTPVRVQEEKGPEKTSSPAPRSKPRRSHKRK
jgi:hypothetical protein